MIGGGHGFEILISDCGQGVTIKLNEKTDLPLPETRTERPVLELCDGTIASPGLTLIATGRKPNVEELGLESIGIAADGFIAVNEKMQTAQPHGNCYFPLLPQQSEQLFPPLPSRTVRRTLRRRLQPSSRSASNSTIRKTPPASQPSLPRTLFLSSFCPRSCDAKSNNHSKHNQRMQQSLIKHIQQNRFTNANLVLRHD
jgi:hypothetical protein